MFVEPTFRQELIQHLLRLGFKFVTLDLSGFRSGSMNALLTSPPELVRLMPGLGDGLNPNPDG